MIAICIDIIDTLKQYMVRQIWSANNPFWVGCRYANSNLCITYFCVRTDGSSVISDCLFVREPIIPCWKHPPTEWILASPVIWELATAITHSHAEIWLVGCKMYAFDWSLNVNTYTIAITHSHAEIWLVSCKMYAFDLLLNVNIYTTAITHSHVKIWLVGCKMYAFDWSRNVYAYTPAISHSPAEIWLVGCKMISCEMYAFKLSLNVNTCTSKDISYLYHASICLILTLKN